MVDVRFVCQDCSKSFATTSGAVRHERTGHAVAMRPFSRSVVRRLAVQLDDRCPDCGEYGCPTAPCGVRA